MTKAGGPTEPAVRQGISIGELPGEALLPRHSLIDSATLSSPLAAGADGEQGSGGTGGIFRTVKRRQGVFLFFFVLVTGALAIDTLRQRIFSPVYSGGFQLQISNPFEAKNYSQGSSVGEIARSTPKNDVPSLIVLMRSPLLLKPVAEKHGESITQIAENLGITPAGNVEEILNVTLNWRDPVKGRSILNSLAQEYTKFSLTQRQAAVDSGVRFLDQQAPSITKNVETSLRDLRKFRENNHILDPSSIAGSLQASRDGLASSLRSIQADNAQIKSQIASVKAGRLDWSRSGAPTAVQQLGPTSLATAGRESNSDIQATTNTKTPLGQLQQFEQELATARATYKEDSPIVQAIKAKRDSLMPIVQKQTLDSLNTRLFANLTQEDEINRQILQLNKNFETSPKMMEKYDDLQGRLGAARANFGSYAQARETYRLERARNTTPWQVISPPEFADVPIEPNLQRNLLRALMLGLMAGLAAAVIRERTDNVFHTPMEVEKELQLPVLGLIPHLPLEPGVEISTSISKMSAGERFAVKESLRSLFTTFRLLRADRNIRLVGVTSSTQGEGKSTSVTIFARTLADLGLNVLIVDSDMRLPMQSRYLGLEHGEGLSTLLSDPSIKPESLIQNVQENLDVLPSGPKPPDPAKLLNSQRCQDVVDDIRALPNYDIILFDSPPCLMLADPILLGEKLDGILFLVGLGKVSRDLAPQASRRIRATGVDVLGLICNQVNYPSRLNDYGYEYGYYYHYAYANTYRNGRYGKYGSKYGTYGKGLKSYIRGRYKDAYMQRKNRYDDGYMRNGAAVKGYQEAAVIDDNQPIIKDVSENNIRISENGNKLRGQNMSADTHPMKEATGLISWIKRYFQKGK